MPIFISDFLDIFDQVLKFDRVLEGIDLSKYLKNVSEAGTGRIGYNLVDMLKMVLFGFVDKGYISLRSLEDNCKVNIRYMYLMNNETPSYRTFGNFINNVLGDNIEELFYDINKLIFKNEQVDLNHIYIDGSKFEANANKYSWVWKKATEKSRYKLFEKITALLKKVNNELAFNGIKIEIKPEYAPDELEQLLSKYAELLNIDTSTFVYGKGHRKTIIQRHYEKLKEYALKLSEYSEGGVKKL